MKQDLTCQRCKTVFDVSDSDIGQMVNCPTCGLPTSVPETSWDDVTEADATGEPAPDDSRQRCPGCGNTLGDGDILCVECGYDLRTKTTYGELASKYSLQKKLMWAFGVVILGALAFTFYPRPEPAPVVIVSEPQQPPPEAAVQEPPPPPEEEPAVAEEAPKATPEPDEPTPPESAEEVVTPEEAEAQRMAEAERLEAERKLAALKREVRERIRGELDTKRPMYKVGEEVSIRMGSGVVHRGNLFAFRDGVVVLLVEGKRNELPLAGMDRPSRLRCDPALRNKLVEARLQQYIHSLDGG